MKTPTEVDVSRAEHSSDIVGRRCLSMTSFAPLAKSVELPWQQAGRWESWLGALLAWHGPPAAGVKSTVGSARGAPRSPGSSRRVGRISPALESRESRPTGWTFWGLGHESTSQKAYLVDSVRNTHKWPISSWSPAAPRVRVPRLVHS